MDGSVELNYYVSIPVSTWEEMRREYGEMTGAVQQPCIMTRPLSTGGFGDIVDTVLQQNFKIDRFTLTFHKMCRPTKPSQPLSLLSSDPEFSCFVSLLHWNVYNSQYEISLDNQDICAT